MSVPVTRLGASAYRIPTDAPEADGTLQWDATTLVLVEVEAGGRTGLGFTYTDASAAALVATTLAKAVDGADALSPPAAYAKLRHAVRNIGRNGMVAMAISAVDAALWDLKARLHDLTLAMLLGPVRDAVPIYGSGGFTSYDDARLSEQLAGWVERDGCASVKMKIGAADAGDPHRMEVARRAIGDRAELLSTSTAHSASRVRGRRRSLPMRSMCAGSRSR